MQNIVAFILSIPKVILAFVVLVLGFGVIIYSDPPRTVCDSQLDIFKESQKEFLYSRPGLNNTVQGPLLSELYDLCQAGNSPGGCFEYFIRLRKMNQDLENVPTQCSTTVAEEKPVKTAIFGSLKLMAKISWGDRGPASTYKRTGWLDTSDLVVYCDLKRQAVRIFSQEYYDEWQTKTLSNLPESENIDPEQALQKSLFATSCDIYR